MRAPMDLFRTTMCDPECYESGAYGSISHINVVKVFACFKQSTTTDGIQYFNHVVLEDSIDTVRTLLGAALSLSPKSAMAAIAETRSRRK
jgi:hypothetical protein